MSILKIIDTFVGSYAPDFDLPGIDNQVQHLSRLFLGEDYFRNEMASLFKGQAINLPQTEPAGTSLIWRN
ncbi:hypothetical protein NWP23_16280 [Chrysosporum ovalisporum FSS-62]|uniref:Uncharacterized protein n=1 Tax=Umezakia ovalisporum FSS-62 TaxID=2971776 RepID=A0AA43H0N9_9CYAN|nr:hypothetical protein [Umezakia ovalisporum]MDH6065284.1 hypothetical protein [Umezakia ovalisporum FSS-62]